jgi:hypothetical protein
MSQAQPDAVYDALFYNYSPDIIIDRIAGIPVVIAPRFKLKYFAKSADDAVSFALNLSNKLASAGIHHIVYFKVPLNLVSYYTFSGTYAMLIGNVPDKAVTNAINVVIQNQKLRAQQLLMQLGSLAIPNIFNATVQNWFRGNNVPVAAGATSLAVTLNYTLPSTNYAVYVTPQWNTSYWITGKTTTGFTINFGTAPATNSALDWVIFF